MKGPDENDLLRAGKLPHDPMEGCGRPIDLGARRADAAGAPMADARAKPLRGVPAPDPRLGDLGPLEDGPPDFIAAQLADEEEPAPSSAANPIDPERAAADALERERRRQELAPDLERIAALAPIDASGILDELHEAALRVHAVHAAATREESRAAAVREVDAARARVAAGDIAAAHPLATAIEKVQHLTAPPTKPTRIGLVALLATADEPTPWVCEALGWCSGRPPMIIGYAGTGKTYAVLDAGCSLMIGRPIWGHFEVAHPCRVLLVDFDAGERATKKRMQRLLAGHDVQQAALADAAREVAARRGEDVRELFEVERDPRLQYAGEKVNAKDTAAFERAWTAAVRGFDVVILDSLRKVAPSLDENDSRSGEVMAALGRVSDATGATILVVHHAGRSGPAGGPKKRLQEQGRGTSAVDGHAGAQLVLTRDDDLRRCEIGREAQEADRKPPEPWYLDLVRVVDKHGRPVGHRIEHRSAEQAKPPEAVERVNARDRARDSDVRRAILEAVTRHAGTEGVHGKDAACKLAEVSPRDGRPIVDVLLTQGLLVDRGKANRPRLFSAPPEPDRRAPPEPDA